jgi:membrane dipeptidase
MRAGNMAGGFFAMFVPTPEDEVFTPTTQGYEVRLASSIERDYAWKQTDAMFGLLESLAGERPDLFRITLSVDQIETAIDDGVAFAIPHIEGAEAINPDMSNLDLLYSRGIRSLGPVWSRSNAFAHGVPYVFPSDPDHGPGLTDSGRALIRACNELGIMLDLSHLNLAGFRDVVRLSDVPLVATHSSVHAICPVSRNLTDWQIDAIGDSGGLIGIAFDVSMLRPDGDLEPETPLSTLVDHIDYVAGRIGIEHVAFGSDFDGAVMPSGLPDAAAFPALIAEMQKRGYDDQSLDCVTHQNWLRVLRATW